MGMVAMLFIMRDWPFLLGAIAAPIGLMAIGVYKKIRLGRALSYLAILCLLGINLVFIISKIPELGGAREIIGAPRVLMEEKISRRIPDIHSAIQSLRETNFMGTGVGAADIERGVWLQILAETGIAGLALHLAFFISLLLSLYSIRRAREVVVSNVAFLSVLIFLLILSHYPQNPYGAGLWAWYALWGVFASTYRKREFRVVRLDDFKRSKRA
jgi:O-antigen ligase